MSRMLRVTAAAALVAATFATSTASASPGCTVELEERRFGLFGATWYGTFPVVKCAE